MAEDGYVLIRIVEQDEATGAIRRLQGELKALQSQYDTIIRQQGQYAGGRFFEKQTASIQGAIDSQIGNIKRLDSEIEVHNRLLAASSQNANRFATSNIFQDQGLVAGRQAATTFSNEIRAAESAVNGLFAAEVKRNTVRGFENIGPGFAGQVGTQAAVMRAETDLQRRQAVEAAKLAAEQAKTASMVAPQSNVAQHRREEAAATREADQAAAAYVQRLEAEYAAREKILSQQNRTASLVAPQTNISQYRRQQAQAAKEQEAAIEHERQVEKFAFDQETEQNARLAASYRIRATEVIGALKTEEAAQAGLFARTQREGRLNPQTRIRYEISDNGGLKAVAADAKEASHAVGTLGFIAQRTAVELSEMARHQRGQQVGSLISTIRRAGTMGAAPVLAPLAVAFGALELTKIQTQFGNLAQQIQNAAAAVGMSVQQYSLLSRTLQLLDGDSEHLTRVLGILAQSTAEAVTDPMSRTRGAFDTLGFSSKELADGLENPVRMLELLRQKFQQMGEGQTRTSAFRNLLQWHYQDLAPILRMTEEEFRKITALASETKAPMSDETARTLSAASIQAHALTEAFSGLGQAIANLTANTGLITFLRSVTEELTTIIIRATSARGPLAGVLTAGGAVAGAVAGGVVGSVGGPIGTVTGAAVGGIVGGITGRSIAGTGQGQAGQTIPLPPRPPSPQEVIQYAQQQFGYTQPQAAALTAQGQAESGLNPEAVNKQSGTTGLFQWDSSRLAQLKDFATSIGANWKDWKTQLQFANQEIQRMIPNFRELKTTPEISKALTEKFEIPYKPGTVASQAEVVKRTSMAEDLQPALHSQVFEPAALEKELNRQVKAIQDATNLKVAQYDKDIKAADRDQKAILAITAKKAHDEAVAAQQIAALRAQYAGRATQVGNTEAAEQLGQGTAPQVAALRAQAEEIAAQNTARREELGAQKQLLEGELALTQAPKQRLAINQQIAQIDAQLSNSIQQQAVLEQQLAIAAKEYRKETEEAARKQREAADVVGQRQERGQIAQVRTRAAIDPSVSPQSVIEAENAITQQYLNQVLLRAQAARSTAEQGSEAWIAADDKVAETQAASFEKQQEYLQKLAALARATAQEYAQAFTQAFDKIGGALTSQVDTMVKDLITGWPQATQQIQYFETTAANGLPMVAENIKSISFATEALWKVETAAAQAAANLVLELGQQLAAKALGSLLSVPVGAGTEAGTSLAGVLGTKLFSMVGGLFGSAAPAVAAPVVGAATDVAGSAVSSVAGTAASAATGGIQAATITAAITTAGGLQVGATETAAGLITAAVTAGAASIVSAIGVSTGVEAAVPKPFGFSGGGIVPSAAGGMVVPGTGGGTWAIVHPNEMVLPANLSMGFQHILSGGTGEPSAPFMMADLMDSIKTQANAVVRAQQTTKQAAIASGHFIRQADYSTKFSPFGMVEPGATRLPGAGSTVSRFAQIPDMGKSGPLTTESSVGGENHFHIHAHDTQTGTQFLMKHAADIVRAASVGARQNVKTMRSF